MSTITPSQDVATGVITVVEYVPLQDFNFSINKRQFVFVKESEFDYELFELKQGIATKQDVSFQIYEGKSITGNPVALVEVKSADDQQVELPIDVVGFMARCLIAAEYPGIDMNDSKVEAVGSFFQVIVGSASGIEFDENGY